MVEQVHQDSELFGVGQPIEREFLYLRRRVREVGVDHDAVGIADHEQERVLQGALIHQQLAVRGH